MLKNYLITILRGFRRTPVYSVLNLAGLALGIACATLIFLWVFIELYCLRGTTGDNRFGPDPLAGRV